MTDRLADLRPTHPPSASPPPLDIESGLDDASNDLLRSFNRESAAIDKALRWADEQVSSASSAPAGDKGAGERLDGAEAKVQAVRKRLTRLAQGNATFASENAGRPATVRTRLVRYTKLGNDFQQTAGRLADARGRQRKAAEAALSDAVRRAGPAAEADIAGSSTSQATAALDGDKRALLEDIRARNAEIARLGRSVEELNQTFQDISILVEAQQGLVNEVEYNLEEVALDTAQGTGELVKTQNYQRKKRRRQIWCLVILVVIIALVILGVVLAVTRR